MSEEYYYDMMKEAYSQDQSGKAGIYIGYGTEKEQKLTELYPNSFFGEAGMISDEPRSATVVALEDTIAELIYKEDLDVIFKENPPKAGASMT